MYRLTNELLKAYKINEHSVEPFGKALKTLVRASGITQAELGKALHVSSVTVYNYIHSYRRKPEIDFMRRIADFFDIKPTYFREYRIYLIEQKMIEYPEVIDIIFEVLGDPVSLIKSFKDKDRYLEANLF
jgi:transcriptional regulator with XRE-family HTH domain